MEAQQTTDATSSEASDSSSAVSILEQESDVLTSDYALPAAEELPPLESGQRPPLDVRSDIERMLDNDGTRLGDAFRGKNRGLNPLEISEELGIGTVGWFYHKNRDLSALLEGELPDKPSTAGYTQSAFKLLLRQDPSDRTKQWLEVNLRALEVIANDQERKEEEIAKSEKLADTEYNLWQGVYVYTFPHYHYNPVDRDSDPPRTIMKIGQTAGQDGIRARINQQMTTAVPEDPLIYRAYRTTVIAEAEDGIEKLSRDLETQFHGILDAAGHKRSRKGKEWFLTSLDFLDALAETWDLEIGKIFDPDSDTH